MQDQELIKLIKNYLPKATIDQPQSLKIEQGTRKINLIIGNQKTRSRSKIR